VIFSDKAISDIDANSIIRRSTSSTTQDAPQSSDTTNVASHNPSNPSSTDSSVDSLGWDYAHQKHELMVLNGERHLCTIPIVEVPVRNETSEAEARAAEQKELARARDEGWELLQGMEGECLYFVSGWWSYSFCYNAEIVQFHQLPPMPGKATLPPKPDPGSKQYVLGRAKTTSNKKEDEWGSQIEVRKGTKGPGSPRTEIQVKGDTRYLVQKLEGGTICDLTGKPRRIEVQYHCDPNMTERIGYVKEVGTCSYLMAVYTPRLCTDVAFVPAKPIKAHEIVCRIIVPEDEVEYQNKLNTLDADLEATANKEEKPITIGGLVVGAGKWTSNGEAKLPIPANFGLVETTALVARGKSKAEGGETEILSDADLRKLDLDPSTVATLKAKMPQLAKGKGWKIEVVDKPGEAPQLVVTILDDEEEGTPKDSEKGSEELLKDEL